MKFHTQFRPGDLVKDIKTGDEGVIIEAQGMWINEDQNESQGTVYKNCIERKTKGERYCGGYYGIFPKTRDSILNGYWFSDDQLELVKKGFLH